MVQTVIYFWKLEIFQTTIGLDKNSFSTKSFMVSSYTHNLESLGTEVPNFISIPWNAVPCLSLDGISITKPVSLFENCLYYQVNFDNRFRR